jgi:uncharacterized membrane protein
MHGADLTVMTRWATHSHARHFTRCTLSILLLAASLLKFWSEARYPQITHRPWIDNRAVAYSAAAFEAVLALALLSGFWPNPTWYAAVAVFSLFAIVTAAQAIQGKDSCNCFGAVQVRPIYTMSLDILAVALLLITGKPDRGAAVVGPEERQNSEGGRQNGEAGTGRRLIAGAIGIAWMGIVLGIWLTRPTIAMATTATLGVPLE